MGDHLVGFSFYTTLKGMLQPQYISIKRLTLEGTHSNYVSSGLKGLLVVTTWYFWDFSSVYCQSVLQHQFLNTNLSTEYKWRKEEENLGWIHLTRHSSVRVCNTIRTNEKVVFDLSSGKYNIRKCRSLFLQKLHSSVFIALYVISCHGHYTCRMNYSSR